MHPLTQNWTLSAEELHPARIKAVLPSGVPARLYFVGKLLFKTYMPLSDCLTNKASFALGMVSTAGPNCVLRVSQFIYWTFHKSAKCRGSGFLSMDYFQGRRSPSSCIAENCLFDRITLVGSALGPMETVGPNNA